MWTVLLGCLGLLVSIHPLHRCEAQTATCPQGWVTSRGSCYKLFQEKRTWREAETDCQSCGHRGHLTSILDAEETNYVATYITSSITPGTGPVWIGLFYRGRGSHQGDWWWMDAYKILYSNWMPGYPRVSWNEFYPIKFCAHLVEGGYKYWKEIECETRFAYICKYELKYQRR